MNLFRNFKHFPQKKLGVIEKITPSNIELVQIN
jgi:hypothetical protein